MKFYTSVLPYRGRLLVRGVNHDGSHKKFRINYKPSLFISSGKESKYKTLEGDNVGKVTFDSMPEAKNPDSCQSKHAIGTSLFITD